MNQPVTLPEPVELDVFARALIEAAPDAVVVTDMNGRIVLLNLQAELLLGYEREELTGRLLESLIQAAPLERAASPAPAVDDPPRRRRVGSYAIELVACCRDGSTVPVAMTLAPLRVDGRPYTIAVLRDLTEQHQREEHLLYISTHDALTELANRNAFDLALAHLEAHGPHPVGVVMIDVDDLKLANDGEGGHAAGDALLQRVAMVLRTTFRATDTVARIGGDEFAVLATGRDVAAIGVLAARLEEAIAAHNREGGTARPLSLSVGVASSEQGTAVSVALRHADARMYSMKREHHGHRQGRHGASAPAAAGTTRATPSETAVAKKQA